MDQLAALAEVFSYLSFLTIGGGMAAYPEMQHLVVEVHKWLTTKELVHIYSVGQLSPGPNMMMVAAIGVRVAGIPGALIAAAAFFLPTGTSDVRGRPALEAARELALAGLDPERARSGRDRTRGSGIAHVWTHVGHGLGDGRDRSRGLLRNDLYEGQSGNPDSLRSGRGRHRAAMICAVRFSDTS